MLPEVRWLGVICIIVGNPNFELRKDSNYGGTVGSVNTIYNINFVALFYDTRYACSSVAVRDKIRISEDHSFMPCKIRNWGTYVRPVINSDYRINGSKIEWLLIEQCAIVKHLWSWSKMIDSLICVADKLCGQDQKSRSGINISLMENMSLRSANMPHFHIILEI